MRWRNTTSSSEWGRTEKTNLPVVTVVGGSLANAFSTPDDNPDVSVFRIIRLRPWTTTTPTKNPRCNSPRAFRNFGARDRIRTGDPHVGKEMLALISLRNFDRTDHIGSFRSIVGEAGAGTCVGPWSRTRQSAPSRHPLRRPRLGISLHDITLVTRAICHSGRKGRPSPAEASPDRKG